VSAPSRSNDEKLVRRLIDEGINRHDPGVLDRLIADDDVKGHWIAKFASFPDVQLVVEHVVVGDGEVWTCGVFRATHAADWPPYPASGRFVEMRYMDRWVVRDGWIVGNEGFWDGAQLLPDSIPSNVTSP
jgi:hypothetical protein